MDNTALVPRKEDFQGIPVRVVESEGKEMMPVVDIARSLKMDRSNLSRMLRHHKRFFLDEQRIVKVTTPKGAQKMVCITGFGAIGLLYKIDAGHSKDPEIENRIVAFQKWATTLIEKKMQIQAKTPMENGEGWSSIAIEHVNFAKSLALNNPQLDQGMCLAIGIRQAEKATGMDLTPYKKLIPPSPSEYQEEYVTVSQIAREIGNDRKAADINRYLEHMGYLHRSDDGTYYLTDLGAQYGKVFPGAFNSGHVGYFIKWKRGIIAASRMRQNNPLRIRE